MAADISLLPGFRLDTLLPEDLDQVAAVEADCQLTPWSRQLFADCLDSDYLCKVVRHESQVVAFEIASFILDESHLLNIAVAPAFQRRGLARALLNWLLEEAFFRGATQMFLEVRESNRRAQQLYDSLGFEFIGRRKNYYATPPDGHEDAWIMLKAF